MNRSGLLASAALCAMLAASPVIAADAPVRTGPPSLPIMARMPAVDGFNAKLSGFGGWIDNDRSNLLAVAPPPGFLLPQRNRSQGLFGTAGSVSVPIGDRIGLQIDGLASSARGAFFGGGGAHLFTRDPAVGLLGAYGSATRSNALGGANRYKAGVEGELYLDRFTISGVAGWEQTRTGGVAFLGTFGGQNIFATGATVNRFFNVVDLSYYPVDNWRVSVGHRFTGGQHLAAVGTEYLFQLGGGTGMSAFVEGRIGDRNNRAVFAGVSFYFGQKDKSLIRRHREDDPPNRLLEDMFAAGVNGGGFGSGSNASRRLRGLPAAPACTVPTFQNNYCGQGPAFFN